MDETSPNPPEGAAAPAAAPVAPAAPRSIGERLRAGRDKMGLSVPAAAEKLHLDVKVIEALEADRFAELGASVYVRGHLKRYAEFVGENALELLNLLASRETRQAPPPDLTQIPQAERRADPRRLATPLAMVAGAGVLVAAIWWVLAGSASRTDTTAEAPARELVPARDATAATSSDGMRATPAALTSTTSLPDGGVAVAAGTPAAAANAAPANAAPVVATPPTAAGTPPAREAAPPARDVSLRLDLSNESWVEVYDARGERLFFDVATAGSVQSIAGRGPLRVYLGNAAGVTVLVDGEAREIPQGALEGEGARFVVNRSGSLSRAR